LSLAKLCSSLYPISLQRRLRLSRRRMPLSDFPKRARSVNRPNQESPMQQPFEKHLSKEDKALLQTYGIGKVVGTGARPALLIVDATYAFVGEHREPPSEATKKRRNACGEPAWRAIDALQGVLAAARSKGLPVIYTKGGPRPNLQGLG